MNYISCCLVELKTYCTGCSNTCKLEMSRINLTIDSHRCHNIPASIPFLNHLIQWKVAPSKVKRSIEWSEHWQWIALQFMSAPRMRGKLRRKQHRMKWWWEQCWHYENSLYLSANKITRIYPSKHYMMRWSDLPEEGYISKKENVEVCKGQSEWPVGNRIPSVTQTNDP